jgi:hypothetical protein
MPVHQTKQIPLFLYAAAPHSPLPMAVSSWKTGGVLLSRGLTVFLFLISGSANAPLLASSVACSQKSMYQQQR